MNNINVLTSSFRDPSGYLFEANNILYRQINNAYKEEYELLINSGLYKELISKKMLIEHKEIYLDFITDTECYKTIEPKLIPFISYPYEWSFSAFKESAILTLEIQKLALKYNMSLKDATAYNVQFLVNNPIFIDTLSFEKYKENAPWLAYGQFCRHFLAPLLLMSYSDISLQSILLNNIDGVQLDTASSLLPFKTKFNPSIFMHIHLGSMLTGNNASNKSNKKAIVSKEAQIFMLDSLIKMIKKLKLHKMDSNWEKYYKNGQNNYVETSFEQKKEIVSNYLSKTNCKNRVVDLGANDGLFSRLAANKGFNVLSCEMDAITLEKNYQIAKKEANLDLLPILIDLSSPSPSIGWLNQERKSFVDRLNEKDNTVLALALIHHLFVSNNISIKKMAEFFAQISKNLIIEFIPKEDSMFEKLLETGRKINGQYNQEFFEEEFQKYFKIIEKNDIKQSKRTLYLMEKR